MICIWSDVIIFVLSGKRFYHQIEMISVIKMEKGVGAVGCAGVIISRLCIS